MPKLRCRAAPPSEAGFALIEVLISAMLIIIVGSAVLSLLVASTRSAAQERARTQAYAMAQEDQARLRAKRISTLNGLHEVRPVTLNGTEFEVESTGVFVNNTSGTSSCNENESTPDYVRITSTVRQKSGQGSPISLQSIVSPSNGSLDPTHGSIVISATNAQGKALSGLHLSGTGTSSFSGTTDSNGCAIFADLPAGTYTLTPSGTGLVERFGNPPSGQQVQVSGGQTQRVPLLLDQAGTLKAPFFYKLGTTSYSVVPQYVALYDAEMGTSAKSYKPTTEEVGSTKYAVVASLFPFKTAYTVYAGACESNKPSSSEAMASIAVPSGASVTAPQIRMPALEITVTTNGSTKIQGARVTITDSKCAAAGKYVYTTEANGHQSQTTTGPMTPALPWSTYEICASANFSGQNHRLYAKNVAVETVSATVTANLNLTGSGSETNTCP